MSKNENRPTFGPTGDALYRQYDEQFQMEASDRALLVETCRTLDLIDILDADIITNGPIDTDGKVRSVVQEARFQRGIALKQLAQLERLSGETATNLGTRGAYGIRSAG